VEATLTSVVDKNILVLRDDIAYRMGELSGKVMEL
jgi:hypothetical protein